MTDKKENEVNPLLLSSEVDKVIDAIKALRENGVDNDLNTLAALYEKTESEAVQQEIYQFFCDLKNQNSAATVMRLIKTTTNKQSLQMLVASCWQSRLNYSDSFETFIDLVMYEGFEIAFEAFTVIDSFEESVSDARKKALITYTQQKISQCKKENMAFAKDIVSIIENY